MLVCFMVYFLISGLQASKSPMSFKPDPSSIHCHTKWPDDTLRHFRPERVLMLTDTSKRGQQEANTWRFYEKLKNTMYKRRVTRALFDLLFVSPNRGGGDLLSQEKESIERYLPHEDKIIGEIQVQQLPPFGSTVTDTSQVASSWYKKLGNNLHVPTRSWVILKNVLIKEGKPINPYQLADSERLLRELPFIRDARIYLKERTDSDTLDALVLTQDIFPYSLGGSYRSINNFAAIINHNNLAGVGHELRNELIYDQGQKPSLGYRGVYTLPNIGGSFVKGFLEYARTDFYNITGGGLQRDFYTPNVRWAGGLRIEHTALKRQHLYLNLQQDSVYQYDFHHLKVWAARAFSLRPNTLQNLAYQRSRFVVAGRFSRTDYRRRPEASPNSQHFFHDQRLYMASFGWSRRQYFRDRYLFGFGRTEDVPYGSLINLTLGREDGEFFDCNYAGLRMAGGRYFWRLGYLYTQLDLESYFQPNGQSTRRLLHLNTDYYSPLLEAGAYRFRQLISIDYTYGDRRQPHEFLTIGHENIRGLSNWQLRGTQRLSFRFETISFTPLYILGFQLAGFVFADLAVLNNYDNFSLKGHDFQGMGLGAKVRNENLSFNTFQFRLSFYPNNAGRAFSISISGIPSKLFNDFQIREPRPFRFR